MVNGTVKRMAKGIVKRTIKNTRRKRGGQNELCVKYNSVCIQGQQMNKHITQRMPHIYFPETNEYYTLIMWDPDAPHPSYLHWLVCNIHNSSNILKNTIVSYLPPAPPSGTHRYFFGIFKHTQKIAPNPERSGFDINQFITTYNLTKISEKMMTVSS